jgi:hypothetical protein
LPSPNTGATEEYDGTSWATSPGSLNTVRVSLGAAGIQTAALAFGGSPGTLTATEEYDGSIWTSTTSMSTGKNRSGGAGTSSSALAFGGSRSGVPSSNITEEWTGGTPVTQTITAS